MCGVESVSGHDIPALRSKCFSCDSFNLEAMADQENSALYTLLGGRYRPRGE